MSRLRLQLLVATFTALMLGLCSISPADYLALAFAGAWPFGADPQAVMAVPGLVVASVGLLVVHLVRRSASNRYLRAAMERGRDQPLRSPGFGLTAGAWLVMFAAMIVGSAAQSIAADSKPFPGEDLHSREELLYLVFSLLIGILLCLNRGWQERRSYEIPRLQAAGLLVRRPRPEGRDEVKMRLRAFGWNVVIEAGFFAGAVAQSLLPGGEPLRARDIWLGVASVLVGAGFVSLLLVVLLLMFGPTRVIVVGAVRQPTSVAVLALFVVAFGLGLADLTVLAWAAIAAGLLLATITCMHLMERGPQPTIGFAYLTVCYVVGYLITPDGDLAAPSGVLGWGIALAALAFAIDQARRHYRKTIGESPGRTVTVAHEETARPT